MAGRNLFAQEAAPKGRNLFAAQPASTPKPTPDATAIPESTPIPKSASNAIPTPDAVSTPEPTSRTPEQIALDARKAQSGFGPKEEGPGLVDRLKELATGDERSTPEIDRLEEIGSAPELNEFNFAAAKIGLGLLTQFSDEGMSGVIEQYLPDAKFRKDEKGNTIVKLESGEYALNKPGFSAQDFAKTLLGVGAGAAAPIAVGAGSGAGAIGATAAIEGGLNVAGQLTGEALGGDEFDIQDAVLSTVIGAGGKGIEDVLSGLKRIKSGELTEAQKSLLDVAEEQKVPVLTSDVIPPTTFVGKSAQQALEKIPVTGTGGLRAGQEEAREGAVRRFYEAYEEPSYDEIIKSLKDAKTLKQRQAGNVLERVGNQLDETGELFYSNTNAEMNRAFAELTKPGVARSGDGLKTLEQLQEAITESSQSFSSFKENRTWLNDELRAAGKGERSQLPTKEKAIVQKVATAMTKDMDTKAKQNLSPEDYTAWKKANATWGEEAEILRKTKIKTLLDKGDITPEVVDGMLFSKKPSEVRLLYKELDDNGRKNARSDIVKKVLSTRGIDRITPTVFNNELRKLSPATKVFFTGDDGRALKGLQTILDTTRRAPEAAVSTATGQATIPFLAGGAAFANLPATIGAMGVASFAKVYESPKVRNAMLRLANTPKGSTKFDRNFTRAMDALRVGIQTAKQDEETVDAVTGN